MPDDRPASSEPADALASLRADWGLDARGLDRVLAALAPPGGTLPELVRAAAVPRRDVEEVLARLEPWLTAGADRFALPDVPTAARPAVDEAALAATMAEIAAGLPPSLWDLDHVLATPATMAARAAYLTGEYDLAGRTLLCVGDHDLTSVAVALAEPSVRALVVDVDQQLLACIARVAAERDLPITSAFADLRLGLPPAYAGRADLAFTDPPYTPEGVGLFVTRALAGLRRSGHERVAIAYGFSPHQLTRGFRTQSALHELRLVLEAVLPRFNRFDGAEAIGAAAALYVARPTRWTWPIVDRAGGVDPRIYTRGAASAESGASPLPAATVALLDAAVPGPDRLLVGDGWPDTAEGRRVPLGEFLGGRAGARAAVNLAPHHGGMLPAVLLAAAYREAVAVAAPGRDVPGRGDVVERLLAPVLELDVEQGGAGEPAVVSTRRAAGPDGDEAAVLAWLVTHPGAALGNAWREALLRVAGHRLTKNEARAIVRGTGLPAGLLGLRLADLPRDALAAVLAAVPGTVLRVASVVRTVQ